MPYRQRYQQDAVFVRRHANQLERWRTGGRKHDALRDRMSEVMEAEEVELKVEDLDKYCEAAAIIVEELRDFRALCRSHQTPDDDEKTRPGRRDAESVG
jgi:hypothetical protein